MRMYRVTRREIHTQDYLVIAEGKAEALGIVANGGGTMDEGTFKYSHTLPDEEFSSVVEEEPTSDTYRHVYATCPECGEENNYRDGSDPCFAICTGCNHSWQFLSGSGDIDEI